MKPPKFRESLFERLQTSLNEGIGHARGDLTLRTTVLPDRPPAIAAAEVIALRTESEMSQAVFAGLLNVSIKTVQSWEQGSRKPSRAALRLIQIFRENPTGVLAVVGMATNGTRRYAKL